MEVGKIATQKRALRREILSLRSAMEHEDWEKQSRQIKEALLCHPYYRAAQHILCYVNYRGEVETGALIRESLTRGKIVYCPAVCGQEMDFYRIDSFEELQEGFHGILEPPRREQARFVPGENPMHGLVVMPGAVFDRQRRRIGYGGGYYDRYLAKRPGLLTLALAFSFQVREKIPNDEHDLRPMRILTENGEIQ